MTYTTGTTSASVRELAAKHQLTLPEQNSDPETRTFQFAVLADDRIYLSAETGDLSYGVKLAFTNWEEGEDVALQQAEEMFTDDGTEWVFVAMFNGCPEYYFDPKHYMDQTQPAWVAV